MNLDMQSSVLFNPKASCLKLTNVFKFFCLLVVVQTWYFVGTKVEHNLVYWNPTVHVSAVFLAQEWGLILFTKWNVLLFELHLTQNNGQIACH